MASRPGRAAVPRPRLTDTADPKKAIRERALALGFDAVGFAPARAGADAKRGLVRFVAEGLYGDMGWIAASAARRADPAALWPEARSAVVVAANYAPAQGAQPPPGDRGNISVYARGGDYHEHIKKQLRALTAWLTDSFACDAKLFVDTAPLLEKPLAERAGLGWQGKHTNLVSREFGSWLFLGEVLTTLELSPDAPEPDHCGACRACLDACPTNAFPAPYRLDARRCISYLTIEHKGDIPEEFRAAIGNRIFGCDDCLAACPWNRFAQAAREPAFLPRAELTAPKLAELAALDDAAFRRLFAGTSIKRTGRDRFVRNVAIAIGNSGDRGLLPVAERLRSDPSPLVREMADWAVGRLRSAP